MTQEDKDLLLRDLCARLPYGVKMQKSNEQNVFVDLYAINLNNYTIDFYTYKGKSLTIANTSKLARYGILLYKPCLFPMSSMTEEQLYELREMFGFEIEFSDGSIELSTFHHNCLGYLEMVSMFDWFNKNHFDYRGLIPKGLAIDATNKNIY